MTGSNIASRYASALMTLTKDLEAEQDSLRIALGSLSSLFQDKNLKRVLSSPVIPKNTSQAIFSDILDAIAAPKALKAFLALLVEKRRTHLLPEITRAFHQKLQDARGIIEATLETAVILEAPDLEKIQSSLEKLVSKKITLNTVVNPDILGGFVVRIQNNLLDMSLKTKLEKVLKTAVS